METGKNVMKKTSLRDRMEDWSKIEETLRDTTELSVVSEGGIVVNKSVPVHRTADSEIFI